jgi:hypothetical protein
VYGHRLARNGFRAVANENVFDKEFAHGKSLPIRGQDRPQPKVQLFLH